MDTVRRGRQPLARGKRCNFRSFPTAEKIPANYGFLGSVASARNACRKLSTGITRRSPACRRASAALSPAGTRKTSAPERFAPITFCLTPPIGDDAAVELELARRGHPADPGRRCRAAPPRCRARTRARPKGPPTPPRSISTSIGQLDVRGLLDLDADDRTALLGGALDRADLDRPRRAAGAYRQPHGLAGLVLRDQPAQVVRRLHRLAVDSRRSRRLARACPSAGASCGDRRDERPLGRRRRRRSRARAARPQRRSSASGPSGGGSGGAAR